MNMPISPLITSFNLFSPHLDICDTGILSSVRLDNLDADALVKRHVFATRNIPSFGLTSFGEAGILDLQQRRPGLAVVRRDNVKCHGCLARESALLPA